MSVADANFRKVKAFPAAAATNYCDPIDLGADRVGAIGSSLTMHLKTPALTALVDTKVATFIFQDSADGVNFDTVLTLDAAKLTGVTGNGCAAKETRFYLPPDTRRHIRVGCTVETGGGSNIALSYTLEGRI